MEATELDQILFDASVDEFFHLAFEQEEAGSMTMDQIGELFPSRPTSRSSWEEEDLEIAEMYAEADRRFFEEEVLRSEQSEDYWHGIQDELIRRDRRRRKRS